VILKIGFLNAVVESMQIDNTTTAINGLLLLMTM